MTDYATIFNYRAQPKEMQAQCNLCERPRDPVDFEERLDRYGYPVCVSMCGCGLVFLNPRMTKEAYSDFYASGAYRRLVSAFHGREINAETIQPEQRGYGHGLADLLEPWVKPYYRTLLDVGGSTGAVAGVLCDRFGLKAEILDPSEAELLSAAQVDGVIATHQGTIEGLKDSGEYDVITLCQTADHLLDPMAALRKIKSELSEGGLFWVDILDYDRTKTVKIDHPYNFTERTIRAYLGKVGFAILQTHRDGDHLGFVCR